jgi:hypothetical protein
MAVSYLRSLGISIVGYYPYDHATDIVGFLKLPLPFKLPLKVVAEIAKSSVTVDAIDGFSKLAKNSLAEKVLLLAPSELDKLDPDAKKKLESERIEFVGKKDITVFSKTTTQSLAKQEYERIRDVVSPNKLIKELPTFAKQVVPEDIQKMFGEPKLEAWQLLEEAVYCTFRYGFSYSVRQLGKEALFKNEPEGVVTTGGPSQFALIYDCKSSSTKYTMSADDERTYVGYVAKKKKEVMSLDHCELKYFVIISPDFFGDAELRRENILKETQVLLVLIKADTLRKLGLWAADVPPDLKSLIDLRDVLTKEVIASCRTIDNYIKSFDKKYQKRY